MAPPSLSSSHLLITVSLPKPPRPRRWMRRPHSCSCRLQAEAPTPAVNPFADIPDGGQWRYSEFLAAVKRARPSACAF
ncbi:unnamed protein product [Triticum turgidum subsp. durum]|uniref:Uncharacterized protein n=1 Tax=Triticum turgidum subsp. durum TaxID=4567 RepID=A0A9R1S813_TRITD|nr:unnamed protein product [Triticum turgidum subsp. durum]